MRGVALVVVLTGCAGGESASVMPGECPSNASTISIAVAPDPLARGDAVTIWVTWTVDSRLTDPVATLSVGDRPVVEVEVPLTLDQGDGSPYEYSGSLLNPFGPGAPPGDVGVLASAAVVSGCDLVPTAATGFTLE